MIFRLALCYLVVMPVCALYAWAAYHDSGGRDQWQHWSYRNEMKVKR